MNSLYDFIVKPVGEKYSNTVKVGDKDLVVNTKIENWKFVNRLAEVVQTPLAFNAGIKKGDKVLIHQNVFRTFYDIRGEKKKSRSFLRDDHHLCSFDQIYLYNNGVWNTVGNRCFVQPVKDNNELENKKERSLVGILKYGNSSLEALGITPGDLIGFTPNSEWEFLVDGERLYCMKSNDIVIKYERKGNEEKYNPSWTQGS
jgi:hypothetical protein